MTGVQTCALPISDLSVKKELYQAELNLATAQSSVEERLVALANAENELKQALGLPLHERIRVMADIGISPVAVSLEEAVRNGLDSRMELRQREIDIELAELQMIRTKSLNEFKGDISLSVGITSDNERLGSVYDNPTQNPRVAISFTVPIFDWEEKKARVKAQQIGRAHV